MTSVLVRKGNLDAQRDRLASPQKEDHVQAKERAAEETNPLTP